MTCGGRRRFLELRGWRLLLPGCSGGDWCLSLQREQQGKTIPSVRALHGYVDILRRPMGLRGHALQSGEEACFPVGPWQSEVWLGLGSEIIAASPWAQFLVFVSAASGRPRSTAEPLR